MSAFLPPDDKPRNIFSGSSFDNRRSQRPPRRGAFDDDHDSPYNARYDEPHGGSYRGDYDYRTSNQYGSGRYGSRDYADNRTSYDYDYASTYGNDDYQYSPGMLYPGVRRINKHLFVWLASFFLGAFGADRFIRGQVGLGLFKLFIGSWISLGIWPLVDFVIAAVKAYGAEYAHTEYFYFDSEGNYAR
ncbi:TM2 domain-containing protein [Trueperella bialowiezensis]|uniref:TM2 domain n=1 Tax=Trueperella bialowiezensis TaxID=312285 RepID=A0A3S4V749_9ACTO|nr:TM2 domain-containing protein [Trueperella bialowiezensis]VEI13508.1 TM2 domain [Trueperella bialowiezensis]